MNKRTRNISGSRLKTLVVIFCIAGGGYSIYLAANAILKNDKNIGKIQMQRMNVPQYFDKSVNETAKTGQVITKEIYQKLQGFKSYMDSLKEGSGKQVYDSILRSRPHLMDSVLLLGKLYKSNLK